MSKKNLEKFTIFRYVKILIKLQRDFCPFIEIKISQEYYLINYRNSNLIKHILRRTLPQDNPVQPLKALHQYSCIQDVLECWEKRHHLSGPKKVPSMIFKMAARQILNNTIYCQVLYWYQATSRKFSKYIFFCICFSLFLYTYFHAVDNILLNPSKILCIQITLVPSLGN